MSGKNRQTFDARRGLVGALVVWAVWLFVWVGVGSYGLAAHDALLSSLGFLAAIGWLVYGHREQARMQSRRKP